MRERLENPEHCWHEQPQMKDMQVCGSKQYEIEK